MLYRLKLDLAIPSAVFDSIPDTQKTAFRDTVRKLKSYAVKINEGKDNEEMTVKAVWHRCHHDTGDQPCEPEEEI